MRQQHQPPKIKQAELAKGSFSYNRHYSWTPFTGPSSQGEITKNNKCGSIIKDDNFMITCADRSTLMAGLIKLLHILGFQFISPRLLGPVTSEELYKQHVQFLLGIVVVAKGNISIVVHLVCRMICIGIPS